MMRKLCLLFIAAFLVPAAEASAGLSLSSYEATFKPVADASGSYRDVAAELVTTCDATGSSVSRGFKFVGRKEITDIRVTDERGEIAFTKEDLVEKKISYSFPTVYNGSKTVRISFIIRNAIDEKGLSSGFDAGWVGNWQIPVQSRRYVFVLPPDYKPMKITSNITPYTTENRDGSKQLVFEPSKGSGGLQLTFFPSFHYTRFLPFLAALLLTFLYMVTYSVIRIVKIPSSTTIDTSDPAPAELAYLTKDLKHAYGVVLFDLLQKGMLMTGADRTLVAGGRKGSVRAYEYPVLGFFSQPQLITDMYKDKELQQSFEQGVIDQLAKKGCIKDIAREQAAGEGIFRNCLFSGIIVTAVGWTSSSIGRFPFLFAFFAAVLVILALIGVYHFGSKKHVSRRGYEMIQKYTFKAQKANLLITDRSSYSEPLTYAVAVLGLGILAGTIYDDMLDSISYSRMMKNDTSSGCSGCSSTSSGGGDGGGGDGGGGDSGGCGGCGGGD